MEAAETLRHQPGIDPSSELAPVIPLGPSPTERGFSFRNLLPSPTLPVRIIGRAATNIAERVLLPTDSDRETHKVVIPHHGGERLLVVTEPDPETGVDVNVTTNKYIRPGLMELGDSGSSFRLHQEVAEAFPDERIITEPTPGISHWGQVWTADEIASRRIDVMAGESLGYLKTVTKDGLIELLGTSLGSVIVVSMIEQNLSANDSRMLNINAATLLSSAVMATEVAEEENFRNPNIDEEIYRQELTRKFNEHVLIDAARMTGSNPVDMVECAAAMVVSYLLQPHKGHSRARVINTDFNNVKEGVKWSTLKQIVPVTKIRVLNGERCPLAQEQEPQWAKLDELSPGQIQHRLVPGKGHLMTADAHGTVEELGRMDFAEAA